MVTHRQLLNAASNAYAIAPAKKNTKGFNLRNLATNVIFKNRLTRNIPLVKDLDVVKADHLPVVTDREIKPIASFVRLDPPPPNFDPKSHSGAVAYYNAETKYLIVAYRGSDSAKDWLVTDVEIAAGRFGGESTTSSLASLQYTKLLLNQLKAKCIEVENVHLTGHSKGGHEAQYCLAKLAKQSPPPVIKCTTYNAPGINGCIKDEGVQYPHVNFRVSTTTYKDVVSTAGTHMGSETVVHLPPGKYHFAAHTMSSCEAALENEGLMDKEAIPKDSQITHSPLQPQSVVVNASIDAESNVAQPKVVEPEVAESKVLNPQGHQISEESPTGYARPDKRGVSDDKGTEINGYPFSNVEGATRAQLENNDGHTGSANTQTFATVNSTAVRQDQYPASDVASSAHEAHVAETKAAARAMAQRPEFEKENSENGKLGKIDGMDVYMSDNRAADGLRDQKFLLSFYLHNRLTFSVNAHINDERLTGISIAIRARCVRRMMWNDYSLAKKRLSAHWLTIDRETPWPRAITGKKP